MVNDRSTDNTGEILTQLLPNYQHLQVQEVRDLPALWLGKNNALYQGYLKSEEEWLLFTDADVIFNQDALSKAMGYVLKNSVDHLTVFPHIRSRSKMLNAIVQTFAIMLDLKLKPWEAKNPRSKASVGIGAFNLIKRTVYESIGTHKEIKMRPDDDLKLGERVKNGGFQQDALYGDDQIGLEWYANVKEFVNGLMKNTFASFNYNLFAALSSAIATLLIFTLPIPLGLIFGTNSIRLVALALLFVYWLLFYFKPGKRAWWCFLVLPFAGGLMAFVIIKSTFLTLTNKGIYWRENFYALSDLKQQQ